MAVPSGQFRLGFCFCFALIFLGSAAASGLGGAMVRCSYAAERCVRHWDPFDWRTLSSSALAGGPGSCPCLHRFHECALAAVEVYLGKDAGKNYSLQLEKVLVSYGCTKDWTTWNTLVFVCLCGVFIAISLGKRLDYNPQKSLPDSGTYQLFGRSPLDNVDYLEKYSSDFFETFDDFQIIAVSSSFQDTHGHFSFQFNANTEYDDDSNMPDETECERFPVSRLVLALASDRFRLKLQPGKTMAERGYLVLPYPPRFIRALLRFLYTGETTFHSDDFFMLVSIRKKYDIFGLDILDTQDYAEMDVTSDIHICSKSFPLRNWDVLSDLAQIGELADFRIHLGSDEASQPPLRAGQGELAESAAAMGRELRSIMRNDEIPCHRLILSLASPNFFHGLYCSGMQEANQGHIQFPWARKAAVKRCIRFIYTGKMEVRLSPGDGEAVLAELDDCEELADYWGIGALIEACDSLRTKLAPPK